MLCHRSVDENFRRNNMTVADWMWTEPGTTRDEVKVILTNIKYRARSKIIY